MIKKIIFGFFALVLGFAVFYFSISTSSSKAVVNKGTKALESEDYSFFLKWNSYYEKDPFFVSTYKEEENTTEARMYYAYSKASEITGIVVLITNINTDKVYIDESTLDKEADADTYTTVVKMEADNGATWIEPLSIYNYDTLPAAMFTFANSNIIENLTKDDVAPKYITSFTLYDAEDFKFYEASSTTLAEIKDYKSADWDAMIEADTAGVGYTSKEYRNYFSFSYPEMWSTWLTTGVTFLILLGLGLFVFWPKKSQVPTETENREKYTYAPKSMKKEIPVDTVDKAQKEKEARENRYKNVRPTDSINEVPTEETTTDNQEIVEEEIVTEENNEDSSKDE